MATRIRLARRGRKRRPFYSIVVADSRAPRDGKFLEKIGYYNPMTDPSIINIDAESALKWLHIGSQPSETVRSLLSRCGIMLRKHLELKVRKGDIQQDRAQTIYLQWAAKKGGFASELAEKYRQKHNLIDHNPITPQQEDKEKQVVDDAKDTKTTNKTTSTKKSNSLKESKKEESPSKKEKKDAIKEPLASESKLSPTKLQKRKEVKDERAKRLR